MTPHRRAAYERARVVPDDSFLYEPQGPGLSQGPELQPRNWLADRARDYGMPGLSNRLNDPTSGAGIVADGVGGLLNMLVVEPYQSMNRMLERPMVSGDPRNAEDAFNVAGAAMVGGLAAPRPRAPAPTVSMVDPMGKIRSIAMDKNAAEDSLKRSAIADMRERYAIDSFLEKSATGPQTFRGYSGSESSDHFANGFSRGPWASPNPEVANTYADGRAASKGNVAPMEFRFRNPVVVDAHENLWNKVPVADGINSTTNELAIHARNAGHDGIVFSNVRDNLSSGGDPGDVYHALRRGTVYSPLTGELLYANGGRPGAAMGAVNNLLAGYGYPQPQQQPPPDWTRNVRPGDI